MARQGSFQCVLLALAFATPAAVLRAQPVSFSGDIYPILASRCLSCHGQAQQMAALDLSSRESASKGGVHGPAIIPGKPAESRLYRRATGVEQPVMPLGGKLSAREIDSLRRWIEQGAPWDAEAAAPPPAAEKSEPISDADRQWWAFQQPARRSPPKAADPRWSRNPIDAFVFQKFAEKGLRPAPPAGKRLLIRRAYLDLTGLLPPPEEVERFVNDASPDAWTNLVDRLLASERYGERWGRHWLDAARYADSGGYEQDFNYPNAWRYRDYVIRSFNSDKPYDRFILEQLAGDELDDSGYDSLIATGFHRVGPRVGFREKDNPQYRYTYLDDMIGTTSRVFLGLTVNCARCHDHKFDPIPQLDYYRLMAVFFPYIDVDFALAPPEEVARYQARKAEVEAKTKPLKSRIAAIEKPYRLQAFDKLLEKFPADIQAAVRTPEQQRTEGQNLLAAQVMSIRPGSYRSLLSPEHRAEVEALNRQIREIEKDLPKPLPVAAGIRDGDYRFAPDGPGDEVLPGKGNRENVDFEGSFVPLAGKTYVPPTAHFLEMGDYQSKGPEIEPGFLQVLGESGPTAVAPKDGRITTGRRRALAEWIASPRNPLTARVMVNRIWQHHFGRGIVSTPSNFGRLGRLPSHPELLDWLASEFVRGGWSVKRMHRLILASETYRMDSAFHVESNAKADPDNVYLWRYPQRRLEGESIRDIILQAAGNLNLQAGGPPFFPPVPDAVLKSVAKGIWNVTEEGPSVWRRSVYSYYKRGMRYPMFEVFDQPDPNVTCEARNVSTVPTQALTLLNNDFVLRQSRAFAERVWKTAGPEQREQVRTAYLVALGREPGPKELDWNVAFLNRRMAADQDPEAALADLCDVILNLNEFIYIN